MKKGKGQSQLIADVGCLNHELIMVKASEASDHYRRGQVGPDIVSSWSHACNMACMQAEHAGLGAAAPAAQQPPAGQAGNHSGTTQAMFAGPTDGTASSTGWLGGGE